MDKKNIFPIAGCAMIVALALAACNEEQRGRPTKIEPGMYQGKMDTQLSDAQREALRQRGRAQTFQNMGERQ